MCSQALISEDLESETSLRASLYVWLTSLQNPGKVEFAFAADVTSTDARLLSEQPWSRGESVLISLPPALSAKALVIYCHRQPNEQYAVGIRFLSMSPDWAELLPQHTGFPASSNSESICAL